MNRSGAPALIGEHRGLPSGPAIGALRQSPGLPAAILLCALLAGCQTVPAPAPVIAKTPTAPPTEKTQASTVAPPEKPSTPPAAPVSEPYRNVYTQEKDSVPATRRDIDYHAIPDAVPVREPRGKYGNKSPYTVNGKTYTVRETARGYSAEGIASWYGEKFHGFRTSSFEPYDMYAMTAAHTSLPIPSYVRVTNLANDRSVLVRVNDRGPFHAGRIIDLSWAAAQKLGYAGTGTARVRVEAIDPPPAPTDLQSAGNATASPDAATTTAPTATPEPDKAVVSAFFVQLGAFAFPDTARQLGDRARATLGEPVRIIAGDDLLHRVRVGPYEDRATAERMRDSLKDAGVGTPALVFAPVGTP